MGRFIYISHPNVVVDPAVPVPEWGLSDVGRQRAVAMLDQPWVSTIEHVVSSPEAKARETATILAERLGLSVEVSVESREIDRSATGFVSHERHEALADRLFGSPTESAEGWERAVDAQRRIHGALAAALERVRSGRTIAAVGHGGVGTLLLCHLLGIEIDRSHDQPGQGHYWIWDGASSQIVHRWRPIDELVTTT